MNQKPAALQETRPMPVESDAAMRAARETVMQNSTWVEPLRQEMHALLWGSTTCSTGCCRPAHQRPCAPGRRARTGQNPGAQDLAAGIAVRFKRLQFTPDMLPPTSSAP